MKKYILGESINLTYNASSKARDDINYFVQKYGYHMISNNDKTKSKNNLDKVLISVKAILNLIKKIHKNDLLFVQSSLKILPLIKIAKIIKKFKVIYLIHDLDMVRDAYDNEKLVKKELNKLLFVDYLIVHNDNMANFLRIKGIKNDITVLQIFDYYLNDITNCYNKIGKEYTVVFAGNLNPNKTGFIYLLDKIKLSFKINVYGDTNFSFERLFYKGKFKPEELPNVMEGNFGLVWEGNELYMDKEEHPYIMINNPHKVSLYIVSELPIIIWTQAALSKYVIDNNIGIVVDNLYELESKLTKISPSEYQEMKKNIITIKNKLIKGEHIKHALVEIERKCNY